MLQYLPKPKLGFSVMGRVITLDNSLILGEFAKAVRSIFTGINIKEKIDFAKFISEHIIAECNEIKDTPPLTKPSLIDDFAKVSPSPIHGNGLFAKNQIKANTHIGRYEGHEVTLQTAHRIAYVLWTQRNDKTTGIEGYNNWIYANSSHNTDEPNVRINERLQFYALKDIKSGEELLYNYSLV